MTAWTQQINRHGIVRPTCLHGTSNGELDTTVLSVVTDGAGKRIGRLNLPAARAWQAMVADAKRDGVFLTATDTYRERKVQQRLWDERYTSTNQGNGGRTCGGEYRYLKKGAATAACPGTSNHGWGGAVDKGNSKEAHAWLEVHASAYGWEWELSSEPWHLHYWPGDQIPLAVLEHEKRAAKTTSNEEGDDDMMMRVLIPEAGSDKDKGFLITEAPGGGLLRTHLAQQETDGLRAVAVPVDKISAYGWQAMKRVTTLNTKAD